MFPPQIIYVELDLAFCYDTSAKEGCHVIDNQTPVVGTEQANMHQAEEQVRIANGLPYHQGIDNRANSDLGGAAPEPPVYGIPVDFTKSSAYEIGEIPQAVDRSGNNELYASLVIKPTLDPADVDQKH